MTPPITQQIRELERAGWKKIAPGTWQSPDGEYWRGPHGAWKVMMATSRAAFLRDSERSLGREP